MPVADDLRKKSAATRDLAARARHLAQGLGSDDRDRLLHYAEELDGQVRQLDAQASLLAAGG
jgi:hypothetical protein